MRNLEDGNLTAVQSEVPWPIDFIKITVSSSEIITITNHHHDIDVINANTGVSEKFIAVGQFLGFSDISDELEIKNNTLDLSLSGVRSTFTATFLNNQVEGSLVEVNRGYYDESTGDLVSNNDGSLTKPEPRWSGRVSNSSITDDYNYTDEDRIIVSVSCKSLFETLFKRQSGRFTSSAGFQKFLLTDRSMEFMATMAEFSPSFGKD